MLNQHIAGLAMSGALLLQITSCSVLPFSNQGRTPDNPIVLDTMDLMFEAGAASLEPEQASATRTVDVLHTELDLAFDIANKAVLGEARLLLTAYFDPQDTVWLDARGFDIHLVGMEQSDSLKELGFEYDQHRLGVQLDRPLTEEDTIEVQIKYTARPTLLQAGNGRAIRSSQGLYFINPEQDPEAGPTQIWSQGETEYNSGWFPCVDKPNEKYSQAISLTVDTGFVTLSNGRLVYSMDNGDGTRTDHWKQELPHSTYLTMIAIGDFAVVKDEWRGKDVWYYVDHEYEAHARAIFGNTPEMLEFYSNLLDFPYPWDKYHQVVVQDFVSGAMENTSAVIHGDFVQQTPREMIDGTHEDVIAHELFHHWFGDIVTSESWTQITMNEGFATYGEYLWWEHKYGKDEATLHLQNDLENYLQEALTTKTVPLIRRQYGDPDDVFDRHSYQKGGRVLHMLRRELGDRAFFEGVRRYLKDNAYDVVEDAHLRLAMEEVTGKDLHWFFDQWFHREGHPMAEVRYELIESTDELLVTVDQRESNHGTFKFHVDLFVQVQDSMLRKRLWVDEEVEEHRIKLSGQPDWYAIDPHGDMLWQLREVRSPSVTMALLQNAPTYPAAVAALNNHERMDTAFKSAYVEQLQSLLAGNHFWVVKKRVVESLTGSAYTDTNQVVALFKDRFQKEQESALRAALLLGVDSLTRGSQNESDWLLSALQDSSMQVVRAGLSILTERDPCAAIQIGEQLEALDDREMLLWISRMHASCGDPASLAFFQAQGQGLDGVDRFMFNNDFSRFAGQVQSEEVYDALVAHLGKSAFEEMTWWERISTVQGLKGALAYYEFELAAMEGEEGLSQSALERLARLRNKKANLAALLDEVESIDQ